MGSKFLSRVKKSILPPRNLLPVLLSMGFDALAISLYWIFFALWLSEEITDSYLILAVVLAVPPIVSMLATPFLSSFSDRTGRRKEIMLLSRLALMGQYLFLIFFQTTAGVVLAILASFGIFTQVYYVMSNALATTICHPDRRGQIASFQMIFASAGWMTGSGFSGMIYTNLGIIGSLSFAAGFALLCGILAMFSPTKPTSADREISNTSFEIDGGENETNNSVADIKGQITVEVVQRIPLKTSVIRVVNEEITKGGKLKKATYFDILKRPQIITLLVAVGILDFGFGPFNVITSVYLSEVANLSENLIALSNTIATFIGMTILLSLGRLLDQTGRKPFLVISVLTHPLLLMLIFFLSGYPIVVFLLWCIPLYAIKVPTVTTIMSDLTSEDERARGMSLIQYEQLFATNIGAIIACFVADIVPAGLEIAPLFPMVIGAIAFIVAIIVVKETNVRYLEKRKKKS